MKAQVNIWGWCVVDNANWAGAYSPHGRVAKISAVYGTKEEAEQHLAMLQCMPEFLRKEWIIVNIGMTFFEHEEKTTEKAYRRLKKGEIVLETDEYYDDAKKAWVPPTGSVGGEAPDPAYTAHRQFRRAIPTEEVREKHDEQGKRDTTN